MEEKDNISKSIGIVRGNVLRVSIALEVETRTEKNGEIEVVRTELVPLDGKVRVVLRDGGNKYTYDVTAVGNVASFEDLGQLGAGIYDIEVLCRNSKNEPMRYMARDVIIVNDATADADIEPGVEFDAQTVQLEAAVFLAAGGGSAGQTQADWAETDDSDPAYIRNKPTIPVVPTKVSAFENDAHYLTEHQDISGKVDKEVGKGLSTNDFTAALKDKLESLDPYTKAEVNAAIREALSEYTPGETVVASVDDIDIVDNPNGQNADTILAAASARMVKEIYINIKALYQNLAGMAFVGEKPTWQTVPVRTYTIGMASADSNITLTDGNGNAVTSPQPEGTPLTLRLSVANGYRFAAAPTALMGNTNIEFTLEGSYYVAVIGALAGNIVITASSVEMGTYSVNIPTGAVFCTSAGASASSPSIEEGEGVTCYIKPADGRRWVTPPSSTSATVTLHSGSIYKIVASNVQADITVSGSTEAIPTYAINLPSAGNGIASVALTDANGNAITSPVLEGTAVKIVLTPANGYSINVTSAKMGQEDLTPTNVNGVLTFTIANVTGNIVITAVAVEVVAHAVHNHLLNMSTSNNATQVEDGDDYSAVLSPTTGATSNGDLRVFVDGTPLESTDYTFDSETGALTIPAAKITGDVDVCATASTGKITVTVKAGMSTTVEFKQDQWKAAFYSDTIDASESADDVTVVIDTVPKVNGIPTVTLWTFGTKEAIKSLDFGGCKTHGTSTRSTFYGFSALESVVGLAYVDSAAKGYSNLAQYFKNCSSLRGTLDLMTWFDVTSGALGNIVDNCTADEIIMPYMPNRTQLYGDLAGCKVKRVIFNKTGVITQFRQLFGGATGLEYVDISRCPVHIGTGTYDWYIVENNTTNTFTLKIGVFEMDINPSGGLTHVGKLICTTTTPPGASILGALSADVQIYVPNNAVDAYKTAWASKASNIHPVSEYTE